MRCQACNVEFEPRINKHTNTDEELCGGCLLIARYAALDIDEDYTDDVELSLDYLDLDIDSL